MKVSQARALFTRAVGTLAAGLVLHVHQLPAQTRGTGQVPLTGGAPPTGVVVSGTPLVAKLVWNAMPNAIRYVVYRQDGASAAVERTPAGFTATQLQEYLPDPRPTYLYTVFAYYADGSFGEAKAVQYISPPMVNPSGFTAKQVGLNQVQLQWQAVPGAVKYRLAGPGLPSTGHHTTSTFHGYPAPAGPGVWKVVALYPGNFAEYATGPTASVVIRVLPPHPGQWLTKSNGAGAIVQVQTPAKYDGSPSYPYNSGVYVAYDPNYARWVSTDSAITGRKPGLVSWLEDFAGINHPGGPMVWDNRNQWPNEAVYGNLGDLGFGRRTACSQGPRSPGFSSAPQPQGISTICYAAAHGYGPGQAGFADPGIVTQPNEGVGPGFILAMMIVKDPSGSVFLAFGVNPSPPKSAPSAIPEFNVRQYPNYTLLPTVTLDTEGPKLVPFACLSCHGGKYNAITRKVDGAQLLPLDPSLLAFASPAAKAGQEEKIRQINQMIVNSDPTSKVAAYIRGLYGNAVNQPGAQALADYIPQGWAPQTGFYRSVVKPYCTMCHVAAPSYLSFDSWSNFQGNAPLIHASVCKAKTMPHAELQFKAFWTQDTGPVYTPGLLAATLGYPSCQ